MSGSEIYGTAQITYFTKDAGGWYVYASLGTTNRRALEDLLKKLEAVLKREFDKYVESRERGYGPLKSPRDVLDQHIAEMQELEKLAKIAIEERKRIQKEFKRFCPQCGKETTEPQLRRSGCCRRCRLQKKQRAEQKE